MILKHVLGLIALAADLAARRLNARRDLTSAILPSSQSHISTGNPQEQVRHWRIAIPMDNLYISALTAWLSFLNSTT
jgi:hypothetical protein